MSELWSALSSTLGLASTLLVGLIAVGFVVMFLFFSVASVLVLGKFLPFARTPPVGALSIVAASLLVTALSWALGLDEPVWALPLRQVIWGGAGLVLLWRFGPRAAIAGALIAVPALGALAFVVLAQTAVPVPGIAPELDARLTAAAGVPVEMALGSVMALLPLILGGLAAHRLARPVEWWIAVRYLVARRRQTFISIISVICVAGVALGVAVITVVLSVMNGFSRVWEEKILSTRAHLVVYSRLGPLGPDPSYEQIRSAVADVPGVLGATPFLEAEAIVSGDGTQRGGLQAVLLKGIDPATVGQATGIRDDLVEGSFDALDPEPGATEDEGDADAARLARAPGVVIGVELADRYGLSVGDPIRLISPAGGPSTPMGPAPRIMRLRVAGIFQSNFFQFDERYVYTSMAGAQKFMRIDDVASGIDVRTSDPYTSQAVADRVVATLNGAAQMTFGSGVFYARDWKSFFPAFFNALKNERVMMFVLLSFIMVVAGFIIIATLIMMIMEKSRDIAILKAMGCTNETVLRVFATQGLVIGVGGMLTGLAMGLVITWNLDVIQGVVETMLGVDVLPADIYQFQELPYDVVPFHLVAISIIAMVLSVGATLVPCWQAARLDPAEGLRFE